jgi:hypothetical protein
MNNNPRELTRILKTTYESANGSIIPMMHVFGIRYADVLRGLPLKELAQQAGIPASLGTEIAKGMKLAQYVDLKPEYR